jgi:hypothetical protein
MHFISFVILHHFRGTYNYFFEIPRKHKNKTRSPWQKWPISPGDVKKILRKGGEKAVIHPLRTKKTIPGGA